jgi:exosortase/archaeosortase family protein
MKRLGIPLLHLLAFWPLGPWYARRLHEPAGEPWCLLPLAAAAVFLATRTRAGSDAPDAPDLHRFAAPAALTLLYAALYPWLPPLVRAGIAVTALTCTWSVCLLGRRFHAGLWALLLLSLPVMATVDFYAGFPLRIVVTRLAAGLLNFGGAAVQASGTVLEWHGRPVAVDAPCAGIRMLWTGAFLATAVSCYRGLGFGGIARAAAWTFALVLAGNVVRATSLFLAESGMVPAPPWFHTAAGLLIFAATAGAIVFLTLRIRAPSPREHAHAPPGAGTLPLRMVLPLLAVGALAAAIPLWSPPPAASHEGFPGWPVTFEGRTLTALPLTPQETRFEKSFPGRIGRFTDGERTIVLRWVRRPSRQMHPAETCFRALGFAIAPAPLVRAADGRLWSAFRASRGLESLQVRAQIRDEAGATWPDVSTWFWAAASGRSAGPWWAVTVAQAMPPAYARSHGKETP